MARKNIQPKPIGPDLADARAKASGRKRPSPLKARASKVAPKIEAQPVCEVPLEADALNLPKKFGKPVKLPRTGPVDKKQWATFLDHLALSSNVSASAREAEIDVNQAYRRRRDHDGFRAAWARALAEGYCRLEAELLGHALIQPTGTVKAATLTARAQKYRLGLNLLAQHRASVKGEAVALPVATKTKSVKLDRGAVIARLETRFAIIRQRLGMENGDAGPAE